MLPAAITPESSTGPQVGKDKEKNAEGGEGGEDWIVVGPSGSAAGTLGGGMLLQQQQQQQQQQQGQQGQGKSEEKKEDKEGGEKPRRPTSERCVQWVCVGVCIGV
jgi:hypothetical protein